MVESSACMMVAVMAQTVSSVRRIPEGRGSAVVMVFPRNLSCRRLLLAERGRRLEQRADQFAERSAPAGIDLDVHAHAGAKVFGVLVGCECDAHRNALHHLHPVPTGVLRRQDGELRAGARADGCDRAAEGAVWER